MSQREIAVRLFTNNKFGKPNGKGTFNTAIYNSTVELRNPSCKYLLDFYSFNDWANKAQTDEQVMIYNDLDNKSFGFDKDAVFSWVKHYDPLTKSRVSVAGVAIFNQKDQTLKLVVDDAVSGICDTWALSVAACKTPGIGKPAYLASNVDVGNW